MIEEQPVVKLPWTTPTLVKIEIASETALGTGPASDGDGGTILPS
jgi:hypothetical protein